MRTAVNDAVPDRYKMWRRHELKQHYDVVVVGGGTHGLAIAYYLSQAGITDVAVLERSYLGSGASGRNTAIVRANYRTPETIPFYDASLRLYERLADELDFNILFSQHGVITLAHSYSAVSTLRERAETSRLMGVDSKLIGPDEIKRLVPILDVSTSARYPVFAALYHAPGGIIRHDAVVWAYARGADRAGVHIHPFTEVVGIETHNGTVAAVQTTRGRISARLVVNATAGWCSTVSRMVDLDLPVVTQPLQAFVTESIKPLLKVVVISSSLSVYVSQTIRGELVVGAEIEPYASYSTQSTLPFLQSTASRLLQLMPCLQDVKVLRQWAGICDTTPDYSPIMGLTPVQGFILDVGWGTYGFKAAPISGKTIAQLIATGKVPDLIAPFSLSRFAEGKLISEKASAGAAGT